MHANNNLTEVTKRTAKLGMHAPGITFLKLINNSSSQDFGYPVLISTDFDDFFSSVYSLVYVLIEKIYQTLETVFHRLSKQLDFRQKYSAASRIFNALLGVWVSR